VNWQMLRTYPVDLSRYLPDFLFQDETFKAVLAACSTEHERQRLFLQEIGKQMYVPTATWGLADWERIVGVTSQPSDTYEARRNRILLKLQSHQTSTQEFMSRLATRYVTNGKATLKERNSEYAFDVDIDYANNTTVDTDGLLEAIETYKPAHLAWLFTQHFHAGGAVYAGAAPNLNIKYEVKPATIHDAALSHARYVGAAPTITKHYEVIPTVVSDASTTGTRYVGGAVLIGKNYSVTQKEES